MRLPYHVYLLRFVDGSYYVGVTNKARRRLLEHRIDFNPGSYVSRKGSFQCVRVESYTYVRDAIKREKQLKCWSRAKKDALVSKQFSELKVRAKKIFPIKDLTDRKLSVSPSDFAKQNRIEG